MEPLLLVWPQNNLSLPDWLASCLSLSLHVEETLVSSFSEGLVGPALGQFAQGCPCDS